MKVNNNYNPLISPLSCSPNLCWELMLLGDLFAKKMSHSGIVYRLIVTGLSRIFSVCFLLIEHQPHGI